MLKCACARVCVFGINVFAFPLDLIVIPPLYGYPIKRDLSESQTPDLFALFEISRNFCIQNEVNTFRLNQEKAKILSAKMQAIRTDLLGRYSKFRSYFKIVLSNVVSNANIVH